MSFDTPAGTRGGRQPAGWAFRWGNKLMARRIRRKRGGKFMGFNALVLTTIGRRSGLERTNPVGWFPGKDGSWLIVASANGAIGNPAWYYNIAAHPDKVQIEVDGRKIPVAAEQRQALCQSRDCDGRPVGRLPSVTRQAQAAGRGDLAVGGYQRAGSFLRGEARPGDQERPAARVVDAFGRKVGKVAEFLAGWQAEFQAGSDQPEPEKRPVVNEHGPLSRCRAPAVTTYSLATVVWLARRQGPPP